MHQVVFYVYSAPSKTRRSTLKRALKVGQTFLSSNWIRRSKVESIGRIFNKKWPFPTSFVFIYFRLLNTVNVKFGNDWIRTADLWTALPIEPQPLPKGQTFCIQIGCDVAPVEG